MQRTLILILTATVMLANVASAQKRPSTALEIYVIDVEGGNATLFVSPTGESLLMDTGNAKAGDTIAMTGLDVRVVTSAAETIKTPLAGGGQPNPYCANFQPGQNNAEDPQSVGIHVTYGRFRTIHLGDLTRNKEFELMCPTNRIGAVDVLLGLHHGQASSNSEPLVWGLHPRVAIMNDGTRKGGEPEVMKTVHLSPGLEDLWQMHFSLLSGQEYTVPGMFIANTIDDPQPAMPVAPVPAPQPGPGVPPAPVHNGRAYWIQLTAQQGGSFTVTNTRNGMSKTYRVSQ